MRLSTALAAVFLVILVTLTDCKKKESDDTGLWMVLAAYFMNSGGALGGTKSPGDVLTGSAGTSSFTFTNESQSKTTSGQITRYTGSPFISLCPPPYTTCGFAIQVSGVGLLSAPLSGYGGSSTSNLRAEAYADLSGADCNIAQTYNIVQTAF
ncbi:MAG: hypothetical protein HY042_12810 [Spirochaetia bacterium]|nr:hypothetical protein [Spirochaetia bacterium]